MPSDERSRFVAACQPWLLILPAALIVVGIGFLLGETAQPLVTAKTRFSHTLPSDNVPSEIFAAQPEKGRIERPLAGDWLSSARPPLQTGLTLLLFPYRVASRTLSYMLLGVLVQSLWIPALWILLAAAFGLASAALLLDGEHSSNGCWRRSQELYWRSGCYLTAALHFPFPLWRSPICCGGGE